MSTGGGSGRQGPPGEDRAWLAPRGAQEVEAERVEPASGDLAEVKADGQGLSWGWGGGLQTSKAEDWDLNVTPSWQDTCMQPTRTPVWPTDAVGWAYSPRTGLGLSPVLGVPQASGLQALQVPASRKSRALTRTAWGSPATASVITSSNPAGSTWEERWFLGLLSKL